jgi:hypothetical protein
MAIATSLLPDRVCPDLAQEASMSTALVPVAPANRSEPFTGAPRSPSAPFLAHLIATARQAPQTRFRRRAEPEQAAAAYAAAPRARPAAGKLFRQDA